MTRIRERARPVETPDTSMIAVGRAKPRRTSSRDVLQRVVLAAPLVLLAAAGYAHRWIYDDGWIYLRVVRQIRVGHGPVFNTGQRVEAFTSPLWTAILAIADFLFPIRLEWLAVLLGIAATVAGAACAMRGAALLARRASGEAFLIPLGVLVFAALAPVWYFETAGLETGLTFFWFGLCFLLLAKWAERADGRLSLPAAVVLGLGWLVRPELVVATAVFFVLVTTVQWRTSTWRQRLELVAAMVAVPLAYEIFRMGYYGLLVSNTAVAKEGSRLRVGAGWNYLLDFVVPYGLWLPIGLLVFAIYAPLGTQLYRRGESRGAWVLVAFLVAALGCAVGVVGFGGDYIHGRLLLPAMFALCAPVAVVPVTKRYATSFAILGWAAVCAFALRAPEIKPNRFYDFRGGIAYSMPPGCCGHVTMSSYGWDPEARRRAQFSRGDIFVSETTKGFGLTFTTVTTPPAPDIRLPTIATGGIGLLSYALGPHFSILDLNGLADTTTAHLALVHRGYPGHEKSLSAPWVAAMVTAPNTRPIADEFLIAPERETPPDPHLPFDEQVDDARRALQCGALRDLRRATVRHLTLGAFLSNMWHAPSFTSLRIPSNPRDAFARLCATSSPAAVSPSLRGRTLFDARLTDARRAARAETPARRGPQWLAVWAEPTPLLSSAAHMARAPPL